MEINVHVDRRTLLLNSLAMLCVPATAGSALAGTDAAAAQFVSSARHPDGTFSVVLLAADGRVLRDIPLSARGHDIAVHSASGLAVAFSRRPGTFAVAFQTNSQRQPVVFTTPPDRHFFGHGAFSTDGRLLYATENNISDGVGVIGIYDVSAGFKKIGEYQSFGIGPHEVILLADGNTLVVANGGLDTMPDAARENLNVEDMRPSLAFVDRKSGALLQRHDLTAEARQLSIRHLAADPDGRVWFGGQWEGDPGSAPGLIGSFSRETAPSFANVTAHGSGDFKDYIGSVAVSADGRVLAASAPKAGRIIYVDTATATAIAIQDLKDTCGLAPVTADTFAETSGFGVFRAASPTGAIVTAQQLADVAFDNHLRRIG